jgi:hypothetical protein
MRKLLLLSWLLLCSLMVWAAQRSSEDALSIARSFFMQSNSIATRNAADVQLVAVSSDLLNSTSTRSATNGNAFYIYNNAHSAYVIVSGDDRMKPVLGYSDNGSFITENLPVNILSWLEYYNAVYENIKNGKKVFAEPKLLIRKSFPASISPLLGEINWNQDTPYNNACPMIQGQRSVTGCVATAMAMILKYYEYPAKGTGHYFYTSNGVQYSFDYGNTTFDWNNMLPQYSGTYTAEQADAVAQLMLACGVAVDMQYSPYSSGAYSYQVGQALIDYFEYDGNLGLVYRQYFTSAEWMNLIKSEINEKRPIYYFGSSDDGGHAFVFDGYDTQDMVHVNWGWSGMNNGYFEVASLNPDSPGIGGGSNLGGGFTRGQGMYLGIQPPTSSSNFTSHFYMTELEVNKEEIAKGDVFKLTITKIFNMSMACKNSKLAVIAEKEGKQSILGQIALATMINTYEGYNTFSLSNLKIPNDFADGTYSVYVATKDEREATWSRVRGYVGSDAQLILVVAGNKCTLTPFSGNLSREEDIEVSVELVHNLYSGLKGDFKMLVSNKSASDEYYGLVGVALFKADKEPSFVAIVGDVQVEIKPGTVNRELAVAGDLAVTKNYVTTNIPAGDYYICPCIDWGGFTYTIGELTPVTIKEAYGAADLKVSQPRLEKTQLQVGENLKLLADLSLSGNGNVYAGTLTAAIFQYDDRYASSVHYQNVFVEAEQAVNFVMEIPLNMGVGDHTVGLYKPDSNGDPTLVRYLSFSVGPATGIEDEVTDKDELVVCQQPVDDILNIRTSNAVQMISVYNLSGQQMIQQKEAGDKKEYSIPVRGLTAGYYIVVLQSADGKVYKSKFMKR